MAQKWTLFKINVPDNAHQRALWRETFLGPETEHTLFHDFEHFSVCIL